MANIRRILVGCLTALTLGVATAVCAQPPAPAVAVHIQNRAGVDTSTLNVVRRRVSLVFQTAGVQVSWLEGNPGHVTGAWLLLVLELSAPLDVGIVPAAIGYACCRGGEADGIAYAFLDRVEKVSRDQGATVASVLAYVVAHEIGHVILGPEPHSLSGIMQDRWNRKTFLSLAQGTLHFTPDQASRIRQQLRALAIRRAR